MRFRVLGRHGNCNIIDRLSVDAAGFSLEPYPIDLPTLISFRLNVTSTDADVGSEIVVFRFWLFFVWFSRIFCLFFFSFRSVKFFIFSSKMNKTILPSSYNRFQNNNGDTKRNLLKVYMFGGTSRRYPNSSVSGQKKFFAVKFTFRHFDVFFSA